MGGRDVFRSTVERASWLPHGRDALLGAGASVAVLLVFVFGVDTTLLVSGVGLLLVGLGIAVYASWLGGVSRLFRVAAHVGTVGTGLAALGVALASAPDDRAVPAASAAEASAFETPPGRPAQETVLGAGPAAPPPATAPLPGQDAELDLVESALPLEDRIAFIESLAPEDRAAVLSATSLGRSIARSTETAGAPAQGTTSQTAGTPATGSAGSPTSGLPPASTLPTTTPGPGATPTSSTGSTPTADPSPTSAPPTTTPSAPPTTGSGPSDPSTSEPTPTGGSDPTGTDGSAGPSSTPPPDEEEPPLEDSWLDDQQGTPPAQPTSEPAPSTTIEEIVDSLGQG